MCGGDVRYWYVVFDVFIDYVYCVFVVVYWGNNWVDVGFYKGVFGKFVCFVGSNVKYFDDGGDMFCYGESSSCGFCGVFD